MLTKEQIELALAQGDEALKRDLRMFLENPLYSFQPRPDHNHLHDQQTSFVNDNTSRVQVVLGGTGSGKSEAAAYKVARFLLFDQPPPRKNTPFWVVSETFDLSCGVCWCEKLIRYIPGEMIANTSWYNQRLEYPNAIILKPHENGNNYLINFMSAAQGRRKFTAASIAGAWISEPLNEWGIFQEIQGRTRDYEWAKIIYDQTPLIPQPELEQFYENRPAGWSFYHLNTLCNDRLATGWADEYLASLPEEVRDTRTWGAFSSFEGSIYKQLNKEHYVEPFEIPDEWPKYRCMDFGNYFATVWMTHDPSNSKWYVYDDYYWDYSRRGGALIRRHAEELRKRHKWNKPGCRGTFGDPADPTSIREFAAQHIAITGARKNVLGGIEQVGKLLMPQRDGKPGLMIFRTCAETIRQMRAYRWAKGSGKTDPKPEPLKVYDHLPDCIRMLISSVVGSGGSSEAPRPLDIPKKNRGILRGHGYERTLNRSRG